VLAIAGQTAEPNWLNFFEKTQGYPRDNIGEKNTQATPGTSTSSIIKLI